MLAGYEEWLKAILLGVVGVALQESRVELWTMGLELDVQLITRTRSGGAKIGGAG